MLSLLNVKNLAVVETASIAFHAGLNVITGETGAGKSVLMGAMHLLLGERADKSVIRSGETEASVTGIFTLADTAEVDAILNAVEIPVCEEQTLKLCRSITTSGNGKISVNDTPATANILRKIAPFLIDIHGPNDQQKLLDSAFQRDLLTAYANAETEQRKYREAWSEVQQLKNQLATLEGAPEARALEIEQLQYAIDEISGINPTAEDDEDLINRHTSAANSDEIVQLGNAITEILSENENNVFKSLVQTNNLLNELVRLLPEAKEWLQELDSIQVQIQELSSAIFEKMQTVEVDPAQFEALEQRMAQIQKLKRRYGKTIPEILKRFEADETRLAELNSADEKITELKEEIHVAEKNLEKCGVALTKRRTAAIPALSAAITAELRELGFLQSSFPIKCSPCEPTPNGMDFVSFCFEPNPGEIARPLNAIASSGEIARVMLAVKAILARHDKIPTLIFDEIDANIGGETGRKVGEKLRKVASNCQIVCITHQPQAAICGEFHFCVAKVVNNGRTQTQIAELSGDARIEEIARMLGGRNLTSVTMKHASEMLQTYNKI